MNQQIEQLALQAGFNLHNDVIDGHNFKHEIEKFAELIVRECMDICKHDSADDDDQFDLGRVYQAKEITQLIKIHFGVEE